MHRATLHVQREFFIDNLLIRNHFIIVMIRWTGLAPWEFEFPFPGSLTSTFLVYTFSSQLCGGRVGVGVMYGWCLDRGDTRRGAKGLGLGSRVEG